MRLETGVVGALMGLIACHVEGFYMPGVRPYNFKEGADVPLKVNAMSSYHTQVPKDYYRLPFCEPSRGAEMASENLGEFLTGNKVQTSPYSLNMLLDTYCVIVCQVEPTEAEAKNLKFHIRWAYHNNWIVDNLPSASMGMTEDGVRQTHYAGGFPIGFVDKSSEQGSGRRMEFDAYVYNHVNIYLDYHKPTSTTTEDEGYRVVAFAVEPMSIKHEFLGGYVWDGKAAEGLTKKLQSCPQGNVHTDRNQITNNQIVRENEKIIYTYDVIWTESEVAWSSRWDVYLTENHLVPPQVHWYSITNSILVVLFLSLLVVSILVRNLRRDIASYNAIAALTDEEKDEEIDETGWKLVHADVFRPPQTQPLLYAVFVGSGVQIGVAGFFSIILSAIGFLSPARRGSLMIAVLVLFMLCGSLAGYCSSRLYKSFKGRAWQQCTLYTATMYPGICFAFFLFFNVILAFFRSPGSVPFLDVLIVAAMWCCVSIPLVFLGAYFGYKADTISYPTVTSTIPRAIPPPPGPLLHPYAGMALAGMVPFAAAYVELFFIMTSLWMDQFYYVFGFTLIVYLILLITCSEVTVLLCYYQLCAENHRWWWYSFFTSGSTAFYMFAYSILWFRSLEASKMVITYLLYFGYMFLISFAIFLVTGAVGALSCFWFIRKIFSTIKVD